MGFPEYKGFNLSQINKEFQQRWKEHDVFKQAVEGRSEDKTFVFYEGPPSANGKPGIHHMISRTLKDIVCRYKTLKGYRVPRKAGWDTHGLPVELQVEKSLGITKEDIGSKISVKEYNTHCRKSVMQYTKEWEDLTDKMGYWVDMNDPYITYDNRYIESVWYLLKQLFEKNLLYKGFTIQPYSPAAGTGLSSHELNQPGTYRDVKDTTVIGQFKVVRNDLSEKFFDSDSDLHFLAWTTTPWTLPSNVALAVGKNIQYVKVKSFNAYTHEPIAVILAKDLLYKQFKKDAEELELDAYEPGAKQIPFKVVAEYTGADLEGIQYEQLISWVKPDGNAFRVITGDFVTTEDGTGIVHIAPTFGADDYRVAVQNDIPSLIVLDQEKNISPLVDKQGRMFRIEDMDVDFVTQHVNKDAYAEFAGRYVKNAYDNTLDDNAATLDIDIAVMLKKENKAFKVEKHVHSYPHCWRTDKPVLYYPLDSWFIRTTSMKDRLIELNKTINWKPESTGTGRFGKWLENLVDWNLSRSRYWGTPLPVWISEDGNETKCIGSVEELKKEIDLAVSAGFMEKNPLAEVEIGNYSDQNYDQFDLHRPFVDEVVLCSGNGQKMYRESDLIDVWFDSGAMPYAQLHYPFENKTLFESRFPADFVAEGVDQTRGWFFTLHALGTLGFDSVAFKNIISNGLVLDKNGNKMSKRLGNAVDPFELIEKYGSDPIRWYMTTNAQPWDNLKFDVEGVDEVRRKFFGTLYNTYSFFALYANVDGFNGSELQVPIEERPEIDRWVLSLLNSLIKEVDAHYDNYEPTRAGRAIQDFVIENLSNWYVRLNRKRFWGGSFNQDKIAAYQTLFECLKQVALLSSPIMPFYADKLYQDLCQFDANEYHSVHLALMPSANEQIIDESLEQRMDLAQKVSSMVLALRRKVNIKVRQPLSKIMVPLSYDGLESQLEQMKNLILSEVNVKELEILKDTEGVLVKRIKANFKTLGPKYGKQMKAIAGAIANMDQDAINQFDRSGIYALKLESETISLSLEDVEIVSEDIPGWLVANEGNITIALDVTITDDLRNEGIARELVNRIQNIRKDSGFNVTDKIKIQIQDNPTIHPSVEKFNHYIASQTLANSIELVEQVELEGEKVLEMDDDMHVHINISKV